MGLDLHFDDINHILQDISGGDQVQRATVTSVTHHEQSVDLIVHHGSQDGLKSGVWRDGHGSGRSIRVVFPDLVLEKVDGIPQETKGIGVRVDATQVSAGDHIRNPPCSIDGGHASDSLVLKDLKRIDGPLADGDGSHKVERADVKTLGVLERRCHIVDII